LDTEAPVQQNAVACKYKWTIWNNKDISIFIKNINNKLIKEFLNWQNEKSILMETDERLAEFYGHQGIKIMGNTISPESLCKKLYIHLKTDVNLLL
jgi:hypothetical protein